MYYDDAGTSVRANGYLNPTMIIPPVGVFNYLPSHGADAITCQAEPGVCLASEMRRVTGANSGFVVVGRSLRVVKQQESLFWWMAFGARFVVITLLIVGAILLSRARYSAPERTAQT